MERLKILLIEPFYVTSHKVWEDQLQEYSSHEITLLTLPGRHWKWRMHGAAVTLADMYLESNQSYDLIIATDMIDLSTFISLTRHRLNHTPVALFFHENQLTYPWSATDPDVDLKRDRTYAWINYTSALAADYVLYNSKYHMQSFLEALPDFLYAFPDFRNEASIDRIRQKSSVMNHGVELQPFYQEHKVKTGPAKILWNHRWEFDKNPDAFFKCMMQLSDEGLSFELIILGESFKKYPKIFDEAKEKLSQHIIHFGYAESKAEYIRLVQSADILPVTSNQDFFGLSIVEAIAAGVAPLLPNRLTYGEHISKSDYLGHFYTEDSEMQSTLRRWLSNDVNQLPSLTESVKRYDWANIASIYDEKFFQLANKQA